MTKCKILSKVFPIILVLLKSSYYQSIIKIKFNLSNKFSFQWASEATDRKLVKSVPSDKATAGEIPVNVLKTSEFFFYLTNCMNEAIRNNKFPDSLKLSHIT